MFERGILLSAGGWEDQNEDYRHDMGTLDGMAIEEYNALAKTVR